MKFSFLAAIVVLMTFLQQEGIYDIKVQPIEGGSPISLSAFAGKKILVTTISSLNPDTTQLVLLKSLQQRNVALQVIAVPAADMGGAGSDQAIATLKANLSLGFMITQTGMVTRSSGRDQLSLFKWLTSVNENGHFNVDVNETGQLFIVSANGTLYSVLPGHVPAHVLTRVLNQKVTQ